MRREPSGEGKNEAANDGLEAASTSTSTSSPGLASGTSTARRSGWMPQYGCPSRQTSPSAWKPGPSWVKPRSTTATTGSSPHSAGTRPVRRNQVVPHGRPHGVPSSMGVKVAPFTSS